MALDLLEDSRYNSCTMAELIYTKFLSVRLSVLPLTLETICSGYSCDTVPWSHTPCLFSKSQDQDPSQSKKKIKRGQTAWRSFPFPLLGMAGIHFQIYFIALHFKRELKKGVIPLLNSIPIGIYYRQYND